MIVLVVLAVLGFGAERAEAGSLSASDARLFKAGLEAARKDRWGDVRTFARRLADPIAAKVLRWIVMSEPDTDASFREIADFISANPSWPGQTRLRQRAEEAMTEATPPGEVLAWFGDKAPLTSDGMTRLGAALLATGNEAKGRAQLRKAWIEGNFGTKQEKTFFERYPEYLSREDHLARLDRLVWEGREDPAKRMFPRVDAAHRALAESRLALRRGSGSADQAVNHVPRELRKDQGLLYERLRWRRLKGMDEAALELLPEIPDKPKFPERWWQERSALARLAFAKGYISEAYRIAKDHDLKEGAGYAEAEWLAGWIALRFLEDHSISLEHFRNMFEAVKYPVSRSRAAYWAGRAANAMGNAELVDVWYRAAARYSTNYYGQLAASRLGSGKILIAPDPEPTPAEAGAFNKHEVTRAVRMLFESTVDTHLRAFILGLAAVDGSAAWQAMTAKLARQYDRLDLALTVAKNANRDGHPMTQAGYPILKLPPAKTGRSGKVVEGPLVLALIRQESLFHVAARSPADARGLMQLMPSTAQRVAKEVGVRYNKNALTSDPQYNIQLGRAYLSDMVDDFHGSYVLALAAYNAGPTRARRWIGLNGDPRDKSVDIVDWIEMIPFDETRNYVQRVLENVQVYRALLSETEVAQNLERDLNR